MRSVEPSSEQQKRQILTRALDQPTPRERTEFLDAACGGDAALRAELEVLVAEEERRRGGETVHSDAAEPSVAGAPGRGGATVRLDLSPAEAVGAMIGRYKLLEKLGEGGFGSVWAAEQRDPVRRRVALKVVKLGMDTREVVGRFEAERQALAMMDHPNIAKVLDAGATETGRPFFVMELVRGLPITEFCDRERMPIKERLELFVKVCQAVQHAHQKGVIHRDLKPSNVLVGVHDGVAVPKVIDFGIAKATQRELTEKTVFTQISQFMGTPSYTSPEQAEMTGYDIDTRSDIYSLGVLLYELLTGCTPFDGQQLLRAGLDEMRRVIREEEPARPSAKLAALQGEGRATVPACRATDLARLVAHVRGDLDWILMKCLEKDRRRRYDTANDLAVELQRYLDNEPVTAMPPSTVYRLRKSWKRNRLYYTAAGSLVLALVAALGFTTWAFIRENQVQLEQSRLRREAEAARAVAAEQRDLARRRLYQSLVREARFIRQGREVGYRREVFDRLQQALALQTPDLDLEVLRREATACLGDWVGLPPVDIGGLSAPLTADAITSTGTRLAIGTARGMVSVRETRAGGEVGSFEAAGLPVSLAFERTGSGLFALTMEAQASPAERLQSAGLESWAERADGTWNRNWRRPAAGMFALAPTREGPVGFRLDRAGSFLEVRDAAADRLLARLPAEGRFPDSPCAAVSADRRLVAFFSLAMDAEFDAQVEVWNLESLSRVARLEPRLGGGFGLAFGAQGSTLACSLDNTVVVYETEGFQTLWSRGGSFAETSGASLGEGATLAMPSFQEQRVNLIDIRSGSERASLTSPGQLQAVRFSENGEVLVVLHASGCRVLHLRAEEERVSLEGHVGGVPAVEFSPDGRQMASTGKDRTLRLWDWSGSGVSRVLGPLPAAGQTLAYRPDGRLLVCGDYATGRISLWSPDSGESLGELGVEPPHPGAVWSCAISPDGKYLAAVGGGLRVWKLGDAPTATEPARWPAELIVSEAVGEANIVFDPGSSRVAFVSILEAADRFTTGIFLRDLASGSKPRLMTSESQGSIIQIQAFLPRTGALLYLNRNREIVVTDPDHQTVLRQFPTIRPDEPPSTYLGNVCVSPDESRLAIVSPTGRGVDVLESSTGRVLYSLPDQPGSIWWLAWSPTSDRLAVSRSNGAIDIWNLTAVPRQLSQLGLD